MHQAELPIVYQKYLKKNGKVEWSERSERVMLTTAYSQLDSIKSKNNGSIAEYVKDSREFFRETYYDRGWRTVQVDDDDEFQHGFTLYPVFSVVGNPSWANPFYPIHDKVASDKIWGHINTIDEIGPPS